MIDYEDLKDNQYILNIYDLSIEDKIKKNTKYIDSKKSKGEDINDYYLQNYCNYKNFIASKIEDKKDKYCYILFCKFFRRYKKNNINIEYNKIMEKIQTKEGRRLKDILKTNYIDNLYKLFTLIKNQK